MPGSQFNSKQLEALASSGDDYYQAITTLLSLQPIAASQGILLDFHIDPRIPAQARMESHLTQTTLLPLLTDIIEHDPWSRLDISFRLCNHRDSRYQIEMNIWGNGCPLGRNENRHRNTGQQKAAASNPRRHPLATSRFKLQVVSAQPDIWQLNDPQHEAALVLSNDASLAQQVNTCLDRFGIITSHADSITDASRMMVSKNQGRTYTNVLVDAALGDKTLNKYTPLLRDVAAPGSRFILLTHNGINPSLIRKYHAAGYFAVVNLESESQLANALYVATLFYSAAPAAKKCNLSGKYLA